MSLEEKINPQKYIKELYFNILKINSFLNKKAIQKNNLVYKESKKKSSIENTNINAFNVFDTYSEIIKSPKNRIIRAFRIFKKFIKYLLIFLVILLPVGLFFIYVYHIQLIMLFINNDINTSYLMQFNNFIDSMMLYISDTYNLLILKLKLLSNY